MLEIPKTTEKENRTQRKWNFTHCIDSIDDKQISIKPL